MHIVLCFRLGILDVFLSCVAKALTVQVKVKGKDACGGKGMTTVTLATSIHPRDFIGSRWWLRGCITRKLAEVIIQLMKDMAAVSKSLKLDLHFVTLCNFDVHSKYL
jgi:E3 ubiquitin-protein ligase MYCBP2